MRNFEVRVEIKPSEENPISQEDVDKLLESGLQLPAGRATIIEEEKGPSNFSKYIKIMLIVLIIIVAGTFGAMKYF